MVRKSKKMPLNSEGAERVGLLETQSPLLISISFSSKLSFKYEKGEKLIILNNFINNYYTILFQYLLLMGFWGFGEIARASCRERV